ncbi:PP2C family protein-serine/threonine phosphatase [Leptospira ilyithenensis]|uniref:Serine/threonine protein phosphatase n=1 Tax=Leptospira ilyithenensis TaxID=2484901 RepID=A0A4R9LN71_9LEPT|nr:PP2C family protein-serine/threonine phosphatase [Leptospira ilyithenensis]TGN10188.1 serine/threonine protein phosphatase [Leptospira ilyithenensis]
MREFAITIFSSLLFFLLLFFSFVGIQQSTLRLPFFYYSSGLITNIGQQSHEHWGKRANLEDLTQFEKKEFLRADEKYPVRILQEDGDYKTFYFELIEFNKLDILSIFFFDLFLAFFSLITSVYFYYSTRDGLIFAFFFNMGVILLSNVFLLAYNNSVFLFFFSLYIGAFLHYHLIYRLRGKEINSKWLLPQILIAFIVAVVANQETQDLALLEKISTIGHGLNLVFGIVNLVLIISDLIKIKPQDEALWKRISLFISIALLISIPVSLIFFNGHPWFFVHRSFFFLTYVLFIITFFYGTYRYTFVPSFVIFTPTIITLLLVSITIGAYAILILILDYVLPVPYLKERWFFNLIFLFILTSYLIPVKLKAKQWIDYWFFEKNKVLREGINSITNLISSPISMRKTILSINQTVMDTLNVNNIIILIPGDQFARTDLRNVNFIRIPSQSEIWNYFLSNDRVTVTSHLEYGIGLRETLYNFLKGMGTQLAFPVYDLSASKKSVKAMILLGEKSDKRYFSIGELKFINEVVKITSMLLENYSLLEAEIQKRKIVRDIQTASIVDNTLRLILPSDIKWIEFGFFSKPAVGISGDYLDLIPVSSSKMIILLGDVAGHGLGTGFLVSAIKGIVREQLRNGTSLEGLFREINSFFRARYKGNEFMTLLGGVLDFKEKTFKFINAGHLALLEMDSSGSVIAHSKTQRVLGILETDYQAQELKLRPDTKLFLFSDGITETFGEKDELFGEEGLIEFLHFNDHKTVKELPPLLESKINQFRGSKEQADDLTFIALTFAKD